MVAPLTHAKGNRLRILRLNGCTQLTDRGVSAVVGPARTTGGGGETPRLAVLELASRTQVGDITLAALTAAQPGNRRAAHESELQVHTMRALIM